MFESEASGTRQSKRQIKVTDIFKESYQELKSGTKKPAPKKSELILLKRPNQQKSLFQSQYEFKGPWIDCLYPHDNGETLPIQVQVCVLKLNQETLEKKQEQDQLEMIHQPKILKHEIRKKKTNQSNKRKKDLKSSKQTPVQNNQIMNFIQNFLTQVLGNNNTNKDVQQLLNTSVRQIKQQSQKSKRKQQDITQLQSIAKKRVTNEGIISINQNNHGYVLNHSLFGRLEYQLQKPAVEIHPIESDVNLKARFDQIKQTFRPLILS